MSKNKKVAKKLVNRTGDLITDNLMYSRESLTKGQLGAEDIFFKWFNSKKTSSNQILRIGGGAGGGKGYFIRYLVGLLGFDLSECMVMAHTGQAVNVLRGYGVMAYTIHSSIYQALEEPVMDKATGEPITRKGIPLTRVKFKPVKALPSTIKLIIIDEASFVSKEQEAVLKRYGVPILEIGDPIQLPPVGGEQCFTMDNLDYFIEGVMRQHADSDIYRVATKLRKFSNIDTKEYGNDVRFLYAQPTVEETFLRFRHIFEAADMIVVSTNKQRQIITDMYRKHIIRTNSPYPVKGEKMICRRNNPTLTLGQYMLTNGTQGRSICDVGRTMADSRSGLFFMDFKPFISEDDDDVYDNLPCNIEFLTQGFGKDNLVNFNVPGERFEYAHAITVHLSQGAQYPKVVYLDSFGGDMEFRLRRSYTAVTRAKEKVYWILPHSRYTGWNDLSSIESRMRG